jgi:hypothetical protein
MRPLDLRQVYLDAAEYVREHGFSVHIGYEGGPRCFLGTLDSSGGISGADIDDTAYHGPLRELVPNYSWATLADEGWTAEDAIAAFEIAADLAAP